MPDATWIVFQSRESWCVGRQTPAGPEFYDVPTDADQAAEHVAKRMQELGYAGEPVILGLASANCLAVSLSADDRATVKDHQSLAYVLEPRLPWAAEEMACALVSSSGETLAVAVELAKVSGWAEGLESRGVLVQSISATTLLALQSLEVDGIEGPHLVLWEHGEGIECVWMVNGTPRAWQLLPTDVEALRRQLGMFILSCETPLAVLACQLSESCRAIVESFAEIEILDGLQKELREAAAISASRILDGEEEPWIELRGGALAPSDPYRPIRPALRFAAIAAAFCLLALTGAMFLRAHQYRRLASESYDLQASLFRRAMPGQAVPAGILSRLRSEYGKLTVSRGNSPSPMQTGSAFETLYRVLSAMPSDLRYRLLEIRVDGGQANLDGEAQSHSDADRIAAALRQTGFEVAPPRSQQIADHGVSLRIAAVTVATPQANVASQKSPSGKQRR